MSNKHDDEKRPHGVTGDTVQQAAEVSKPTSTVGRAIDSDKVPQAPVNPETAGGARENPATGRHRDT